MTFSQAFIFSNQDERALNSIWHSVSRETFSLHCLDSDDLREQFKARKKELEQEAKKKAAEQNVVGDWIGGILEDLTGMWNNMDDVVDDFVGKRMGAGEQFYGKRKYNPSGKYHGNYNGMGRSDLVQIEIARALREERELRKFARLAKTSMEWDERLWILKSQETSNLGSFLFV